MTSAISQPYRGVAQLVARVLWEHEVASSNLVTPTIFSSRILLELRFKSFKKFLWLSIYDK